MRPNLLILGGTTEATALCKVLHAEGIKGVVSLAGRVENPRPQPLEQRIGGFGGVAGLVAYLRTHRVTHLVDATHPFAARMSAHAVEACAQAGIPLIALTRLPWTEQPGDRWQRVPNIAGAVAALDGPPHRVMLAVGRMHLGAFAVNPRHFYLLRLVDPPAAAPPFLDHHVEVSRGPFTFEGDRALMEGHGIDLVVSKNAGGTAAYAKIAAARALGLPVLMIERPRLPRRLEVTSVEAVLWWLTHTAADLGV